MPIWGARREVARGCKGLLDVMGLEVPADSVGTVAGAQSWRQSVPDFRRCDKRSYEHPVPCVQTE